MVDLKEKVFASTNLYEGKIINLRIDKVELPDGQKSSREIVENSEAIAVIPYQQEKVILINQYRSAIQKELIEVPAGKIEINEKAIEAARRELEEETGYRAGNFKKIGEFYTSPGFTTEVVHLYLATDLTQYSQKQDAEEFIEIKEFTIDELKSLVNEKKLNDLKTFTASYYLLNYLSTDE